MHFQDIEIYWSGATSVLLHAKYLIMTKTQHKDRNVLSQPSNVFLNAWDDGRNDSASVSDVEWLCAPDILINPVRPCCSKHRILQLLWAQALTQINLLIITQFFNLKSSNNAPSDSQISPQPMNDSKYSLLAHHVHVCSCAMKCQKYTTCRKNIILYHTRSLEEWGTEPMITLIGCLLVWYNR